MLPLHGDAAEIGLIADFVVEAVEVAQLAHDAPDHRLLHCQQSVAAVQRENIGPRAAAQALHVVGGVQRAEIPIPILIIGAEQIEFDDHSSCHCLPYTIL